VPDVDFASLLSQQANSVERPKLYPVGNYDAIIVSHKFDKSSRKQTDYCRFSVKLLGPREDVDPDSFEEAGGAAGLAERREINLDFYLTKDALWRLVEFMKFTLEMEFGERNVDECIPDTTNLPLVVEIVHQAGSKAGEFYMNINDTAPAQ